MTKPKKATTLSHPVEPSKWARIRDAERVSYDTAQPIRTNWQTAGNYTCPELQHRSTAARHPSLIAGRRVGGESHGI
ncbi:MAG: hypothetical protein EOO29_54570 [Comamonadaceae bacterium]|nr:MAG: hypothetical protein EOO29_54570 [Comamonadaceae bacterium]